MNSKKKTNQLHLTYQVSCDVLRGFNLRCHDRRKVRRVLLRAKRLALCGNLEKGKKSTSGQAVQGAWDAVVNALHASFRILGKRGLDLSIKSGRDAAAGIEKLRLTILKIYVNQGLDPLLAYLKDLSFEATWSYVNKCPMRKYKTFFRGVLRKSSRFDRKTWARLGRLGRSLPCASDAKVAKSIETHRSDMLGADPSYHIPNSVAECLQEVIYELVAHEDFSPGADRLHSLSSASSQFSREDGGLLRDMREYYVKTCPKLLDPKAVIDFFFFANRKAGKNIYDLWRQPEKVVRYEVPRARVVALKELGAKVRVITAMDFEEVSQGHRIRDTFWDLLKVSGVVDLDGPEDIVLNMERQPGDIMYSADLSRATDLAPHPLGRHIGMLLVSACEQLGKPINKSLRSAIDRCFGPFKITYPDGSEIVSNQGWLMGMPPTWLFLNIAHMAVARAAGMKRYVIKGDDLISCCPRDVALRYESLMEQTGFAINRSKSFCSRSSGVFAEVVYDVGMGGVLRVVPTLPLKTLVKADLQDLDRLTQKIEQMPDLWQRLRWCMLVHRAYAPFIKVARREKVPLYLPRSLGGLGLPHRRGLKGALKTDLVFATCAITRGDSLSSLYSDRNLALIRSSLINENRHTTRSMHMRGHLGRYCPGFPSLERLVLEETFLDSLKGITFNKESKVNLRRVGKAIKAYRTKYNRSGTAAWVSRKSSYTYKMVDSNGYVHTVEAPLDSGDHLIDPDQWTYGRLTTHFTSCELHGTYYLKKK